VLPARLHNVITPPGGDFRPAPGEAAVAHLSERARAQRTGQRLDQALNAESKS
jgi:hypothetical protein